MITEPPQTFADTYFCKQRHRILSPASVSDLLTPPDTIVGTRGLSYLDYGFTGKPAEDLRMGW